MKLIADLPSGSCPMPYRFLRVSGTAFDSARLPISVRIIVNGKEENAIWGLPNFGSFDGTEASYYSGFTKVIDLGDDAFEREHTLSVIADAGGETQSKTSSFVAVLDRDAPKVGNYAAGTHPDFRAFGEAFLSLACACGLQKDSHVVEIGPGAGRLSVAVAAFLEGGSLKAFDVDRSAIDFCKANISSRYPLADFILVDERNTVYNPFGKKSPKEGAIAVSSASKDFAYCWSVFTHFVEEDFRTYLNEFARILKPGGRAVFSIFLYEPGKMNREFFDMGGGFWTSNRSKPEAAIAVERDVFEEIVHQSSFRSLSIINRSEGVIGKQDVAVAVR
ncbi:MAG: class I SAM-dependent methyltransferase [Rhodobacteraceae bacterium]|nr:class I SAM-dependent methyltransferase [Paracoccaceae bacterium]